MNKKFNLCLLLSTYMMMFVSSNFADEHLYRFPKIASGSPENFLLPIDLICEYREDQEGGFLEKQFFTSLNDKKEVSEEEVHSSYLIAWAFEADDCLLAKNLDGIRSKKLKDSKKEWERFCDYFYGVVESFFNFIENYRSSKVSLDLDVEDFFREFLGPNVLQILGYDPRFAEIGFYGDGEINDLVRVTLINGILNEKNDFVQSLDLVSHSHGNTNVHYVFRPTEGVVWDLFKSMLVKCGFISRQARQLAEAWKLLIQEMGGVAGGGTIIHYAHSIGGADTSVARHLLSIEEQQMIQVVTFGSPILIPNKGFQSVVNVVSVRDGIPLLDPLGSLSGLLQPDANVNYVGSHFGIPFIDHLFSAETYRSVIEMLGQKFVERYTQ